MSEIGSDGRPYSALDKEIIAMAERKRLEGASPLEIYEAAVRILVKTAMDDTECSERLRRAFDVAMMPPEKEAPEAE
jgi:hypothetical protein